MCSERKTICASASALSTNSKLLVSPEELARADPRIEGLRKHAIEALEAGINSVQPSELFRKKVTLQGEVLQAGGVSRRLGDFRRIYVLGAGKAALAMTRELVSILGDRVAGGEVITNVPQISHIGPVRISPGAHPVPNSLSFAGSRRLVDLASSGKEEDLFVVLISGGASAMFELPQPPLTDDECATVYQELLTSGANIVETNSVRKHLSMVKGGKLQAAIHPSSSLTLAISDVLDDLPDVIASGPTVPDESSFRDALEVVHRFSLQEHLPQAALNILRKGAQGLIEETPKKGDPCFRSSDFVLLGSSYDACIAAHRFLEGQGYRSVMLTDRVRGEAREVGKVLSGLARTPADRRAFDALVLGGETTVTVKGKGVGGRNQELCLSASLELQGARPCVVASIGTDGIDGQTDAAGAIVDPFTLSRARDKGLDPLKLLNNNDSGTFFKKLGERVVTGPTGTNVSDLILVMMSR